MSGATAAAMLAAGFKFSPVTRVYNTNGSGTEIIPVGASQVVIEGEGASASGGNGAGTGCNTAGGGGGGAGGYLKKTLALTSADWGLTLGYVIGLAGAVGPNPGTASTVSSGTKTITTLTANGGAAGGNAPNGSTGGAAGAGGTATNGDTNTTGGAGQVGTTGGGGRALGGVGITGTNVVERDGGKGSMDGVGNQGLAGLDGQVAFAYT